MGAIEKIVQVIELIISFHPCGIPILLGEHPLPTDEEWLELLRAAYPVEDTGVRVQTGPARDLILNQVASLDEIERIIARVGWNAITESARAVRAFSATDWNIFVMHIRFVGRPYGSRIEDESALQRVARRFGVSPRTVTRKRQEIPRMIARDAVGNFQEALNI